MSEYGGGGREFVTQKLLQCVGSYFGRGCDAGSLD
jgi:hypothetical protein